MDANWELHLAGMLRYAAATTCRRSLVSRWAGRPEALPPAGTALLLAAAADRHGCHGTAEIRARCELKFMHTQALPFFLPGPS